MEKFKDIKQLHTKILIPVDMHDIVSDLRLLIPFTNRDKIGFMNNQGMIIVKPQYTMYYGDCYSPTDLIKVSINESYGFIKNKEFSFFAMGAAMIGIENVINSFCHIRMPVLVTTLSSTYSLIFGIIIGSIVVIIIKKLLKVNWKELLQK